MSDSDWVETWKEHTDAYERILSVATTVRQPQPVAYIADEAHVAESTARRHLTRLADLGVLKQTNEFPVEYVSNPDHRRMQAIEEYRREHTPRELRTMKAEIEEEIATLQETFDVDSSDQFRERFLEYFEEGDPTEQPEHFPDEYETALTEYFSDTALNDYGLVTKVQHLASDWGLLSYRRDLITEALAKSATEDSAPLSDSS